MPFVVGRLVRLCLGGSFWGEASPETSLSKTNERIEVDMTNYSNKQKHFGAVDYHTGEFLVKAYPQGNSDLKLIFYSTYQLKVQRQRLVVVWDGASYHRSEQMQQCLEQVNAGKIESHSEDQRPTTVLSISILQIPGAVVYAISRWSSV